MLPLLLASFPPGSAADFQDVIIPECYIEGTIQGSFRSPAFYPWLRNGQYSIRYRTWTLDEGVLLLLQPPERGWGPELAMSWDRHGGLTVLSADEGQRFMVNVPDAEDAQVLAQLHPLGPQFFARDPEWGGAAVSNSTVTALDDGSEVLRWEVIHGERARHQARTISTAQVRGGFVTSLAAEYHTTAGAEVIWELEATPGNWPVPGVPAWVRFIDHAGRIENGVRVDDAAEMAHAVTRVEPIDSTTTFASIVAEHTRGMHPLPPGPSQEARRWVAENSIPPTGEVPANLWVAFRSPSERVKRNAAFLAGAGVLAAAAAWWARGKNKGGKPARARK